MITVPAGIRVLVATQPVDFRRGARERVPTNVVAIVARLLPTCRAST
jgi:hypothetical protein